MTNKQNGVKILDVKSHQYDETENGWGIKLEVSCINCEHRFDIDTRTQEEIDKIMDALHSGKLDHTKLYCPKCERHELN